MSTTSPRWPRGSLMDRLSARQQVELAGLGAPGWFDAGATLIGEGVSERSVFLLLSGRVKVHSTSRDGQVALLAVRLEGDVVGELAALDGGPRSASVVAASRTAVRVIRDDEFLSYMSDRPVVAEIVRRTVVGKLREATRRRADLGSATVLIRLTRLLLQLAERHGQPVPQGLLLDLHLSQADLAALINAGEKSVHRALSELRGRSLVLTGGRRQLLLRDVDGLAALESE